MVKYIDADVLKAAIVKMMPHDKCGEEMPEDMAATDMAVSVIQEIEEMPAADVEPVRHGKWDYADWPSKTSNRFCSVCGCSEKIYAYNKGEFKYCRQCGAKMDGGSE